MLLKVYYFSLDSPQRESVCKSMNCGGYLTNFAHAAMKKCIDLIYCFFLQHHFTFSLFFQTLSLTCAPHHSCLATTHLLDLNFYFSTILFWAAIQEILMLLRLSCLYSCILGDIFQSAWWLRFVACFFKLHFCWMFVLNRYCRSVYYLVSFCRYLKQISVSAYPVRLTNFAKLPALEHFHR